MKQPARARWIWLFAMLLFTGVLILASWDRGVAIGDRNVARALAAMQ